MFDFVRRLFSTEGFPPRWHCGDWSALHGWVHVCSDAAIFGAYAAIPVALAYFALKRKDVPFLPIFWLFGAFILACGTGHLIEATIFWHPWYRLSGAVKLFTAVVSWGTVVALIRIVPQALHLPGLAKVNGDLVREIEEKKAVAASLRRIETFQSAVLGASLDAIITIDQAGKVVEWNNAAERIFGYSADAATGKELTALIVPERLHGAHRDGLARLLATGEGPVLRKLIELPARRADGTEILVELFITPIHVDGVHLFTGFARDITERKRSEDASQWLAAIVESSEDAIIGRDPTGRIISWNRAAERIFGYSPEEMMGQPLEVIIPEERRDEEAGILERIWQGERIKTYETTRRHKNGNTVHVAVTVSLIKDAQGRFAGVSKISRDISERKHSEAQREAALEESEMLLREVHHRVKNNMQVISSLLSLHAGKLNDRQQKGVFAECQDRIRVMSLIHERLYGTGQFARIEFGGYLAEMTRMILGSSTEAGSRVRLDLQCDKLDINLDAAVPLSLIASELVINALKHGFAGGRAGVLSVKLRAGADLNELTVKDDGPGLPPDFTPDQSTGIGIELIGSLTRQIRGQREFQSGPGGTSVIIRWSAQRHHPEQSGSAANP